MSRVRHARTVARCKGIREELQGQLPQVSGTFSKFRSYRDFYVKVASRFV